jgi:hypothetical protein
MPDRDSPFIKIIFPGHCRRPVTRPILRVCYLTYPVDLPVKVGLYVWRKREWIDSQSNTDAPVIGPYRVASFSIGQLPSPHWVAPELLDLLIESDARDISASDRCTMAWWLPQPRSRVAGPAPTAAQNRGPQPGDPGYGWYGGDIHILTPDPGPVSSTFQVCGSVDPTDATRTAGITDQDLLHPTFPNLVAIDPPFGYDWAYEVQGATSGHTYTVRVTASSGGPPLGMDNRDYTVS